VCAAALGGCKDVALDSINYGKTREQFQAAIANFGAIKYKLAKWL
jgi:alkylation response protein AidB-like acyl-CoA dehydrogenase